MSGGVDSSVAAALLKRSGLNVIGVTMSVWEGGAASGSCCSMDDASDARRVAERLGIPHYVVNAKDRFREKVVNYFTGEYLAGRTPNPCVVCNQSLKFDYLFELGRKLGAARVATGHYARLGEWNGRPAIMRAIGREKDQSYFLFAVSPERLGGVIFPLGGMAKSQTRELARELGLPVAEKPDSQEVCFVPDGDYKSFVRAQSGGQVPPEGDIITRAGEVLGRHRGLMDFTIGQRRGLGLSAPEPLYVTDVRPDTNHVVVGAKDELYGKALLASCVNWLIPAPEALALPLTARVRHRHPDAPARVTALSGDRAEVVFEEPQLSITPGQAVVFYHGEYLAGGGWIERRLD